MQEFEKRVRTVMGKIFGIEDVTIPTNASQESFIQWDSLMHMSFLLALEDEFGIEFSDEEIAGLTSLVKLIESIEEKCS